MERTEHQNASIKANSVMENLTAMMARMRRMPAVSISLSLSSAGNDAFDDDSETI